MKGERDICIEMAGRWKTWKRSPRRLEEGNKEQSKNRLWINVFVYGLLDVYKTIFKYVEIQTIYILIMLLLETQWFWKRRQIGAQILVPAISFVTLGNSWNFSSEMQLLYLPYRIAGRIKWQLVFMGKWELCYNRTSKYMVELGSLNPKTKQEKKLCKANE